MFKGKAELTDPQTGDIVAHSMRPVTMTGQRPPRFDSARRSRSRAPNSSKSSVP